MRRKENVTNNCSLFGRISTEIDLRVNGETTVATFSLAVNRRGKDKGADFLRCKAFNKQAEVINTYFHKGSRIALVASATQPPKYTNKDGNTIYPNVEFIVNSIDFVDTKAENEQATQQQSAPSQKPDDFMSIPDGMDSDLPFH